MPRSLRQMLGELFDEPLMQQALTHRSVGGEHNERLEFLGDAVLDVAVSDLIYRRFPAFDEGRLTRLRAHLVKKATLAGVASELELAPLIIVGRGEQKNGARDTLMANALEAVIGALYLLRGMDAAVAFVTEVFAERLLNPPGPETLKDPKSRLQEHLQAGGHALPVYESDGMTDAGAFRVVCRVAAFNVECPGEGASKRKAEQAAAAAALQRVARP